MPWVVSGLFATEPSLMLGDDLATLPDDDAIRIGMNLDGPTERTAWKPSKEAVGSRISAGFSSSKTSAIVRALSSG